ncbi:hypothetical protein CYMTET_32902 [Cymbomonas tetramitiformis]|uniref:Uncharacterized protein n=1 Tax=Cymbomonas tetramitiformis TaxID=36881 RepID=A0AAE0FES6_9CHLO|nr:hypothetical protein CYMTET_32902 [Cymbomonas tetramitiformis]
MSQASSRAGSARGGSAKAGGAGGAGGEGAKGGKKKADGNVNVEVNDLTVNAAKDRIGLREDPVRHNEWPNSHLAACPCCAERGATRRCMAHRPGVTTWASLCAYCGKDHANIYCNKCKYPDLVYCTQEHLEADAAAHAPRCLLQVRLNKASQFVRKKDFPQALKLLQGCVQGAKEQGQRYLYAEAMRSMGHVKGKLDERDRAMEYVSKALSLYKELGDLRGQAYCYIDMSWIYRPKNQTDQRGYDLSKRALEIAEMELLNANKLAKERCQGYQKSEIARAQALVAAAQGANGRMRFGVLSVV